MDWLLTMHRAATLTISTVLAVGLGLASPAMASDSPDPFAYISTDAPGFDEYQALIERLNDDGAEILLIQRTFLGRVRIVCTAHGKVREVVISPNTGEIRRDIIVGDYDPAEYTAGKSGRTPGRSNAKSGGRGNSGNSGGGGGGNSGGGGGNSGGGRGR